MKTRTLILILSMIICHVNAQKRVYELPSGRKHQIETEKLEIRFTDSKDSVKTAQPKEVPDTQTKGFLSMAAAAGIAAKVIPGLVNIGYKSIEKMIAKRQKSYGAEYPFSQSYLGAGKWQAPDFVFRRQIRLPGENEYRTALEIRFKRRKIEGMKDAWVYYIDGMDLHYATARARKDDRLDYTITIAPVIYEPGKEAQQELKFAPIVVPSVGSGERVCVDENGNPLYRTDIVLVPAEAHFMGVRIHVTESNPRAIRVEEVLENWNTYKDDVKSGMVDQVVQEVIDRLTQAAQDNKK